VLHFGAIKENIKLSQYEAYITRKVVKEPFHCHILLFQNNRLDVIARVNDEVLPACQKPAIIYIIITNNTTGGGGHRK